MKEKVVGLFSGGIDSPLAILLASKKFEVLPVHFCLYPMASEESSLLALESLKELKGRIEFEKAIIFPWAGILSKIQSETRRSYACVTCRRAMLKTSEQIGRTRGASGIVTGESLGQKASQTVENIVATSSDIDMPIIRPLIGMNKDEITKISKEKNTWKEKHSGCCLATPQKPKTEAKADEVDREMKKIDLQNLIGEAEEHIMEVENFDRDFDNYLFRIAGELG